MSCLQNFLDVAYRTQERTFDEEIILQIRYKVRTSSTSSTAALVVLVEHQYDYYRDDRKISEDVLDLSTRTLVGILNTKRTELTQ